MQFDKRGINWFFRGKGLIQLCFSGELLRKFFFFFFFLGGGVGF